jgi:hypothetical protein
MNSKILKIFPHLSAALKEREGSEFTKSATEYLENIKYHFDFMFESKVYAEDILRSIAMYGIDGLKIRTLPDNKILIDENSINEIARFGDITIRGASTALEVALLLTNFVAGSPIRQNELSWGGNNNSRSLKTQLVRIDSIETNELVDAIATVWDSIGQHLIRDYRDWVTHRGAPLVLSKKNWNDPIPLPAALAELKNERKTEKIIRDHLRSIISNNVWIACAPFYPSIKEHLDGRFKEGDDSDASIFDIQGGDFTTSSAGEFRLSDFLKNKETYLAMHDIGVAEYSFKYAGETLSTYKVEEYLDAIDRTTRFIWECFVGEWDAKLAKLFLLNEDKNLD